MTTKRALLLLLLEPMRAMRLQHGWFEKAHLMAVVWLVWKFSPAKYWYSSCKLIGTRMLPGPNHVNRCLIGETLLDNDWNFGYIAIEEWQPFRSQIIQPAISCWIDKQWVS